MFQAHSFIDGRVTEQLNNKTLSYANDDTLVFTIKPFFNNSFFHVGYKHFNFQCQFQLGKTKILSTVQFPTKTSDFTNSGNTILCELRGIQLDNYVGPVTLTFISNTAYSDRQNIYQFSLKKLKSD